MHDPILLICPDYKPNLGGIAELSHQVALQLQKIGWTVMVLTPEADAKEFDAQQPFEIIRELPVLDKQQQSSSGLIRKFRSLWGQLELALKLRSYSQRLRQLLKERQIGYVLTTASVGHVRWLGLLGSPIRKGIIYHGDDVISLLRKRWYIRRWLYSRITADMTDVFCNSHFTAETATKAFGRSIDPVVIGCGINPDALPLAVDRQEARARLHLHERHILLTVGRLVPRKGVDMVIRALPQVISCVGNVLYVVAGGGPDLPRLRQLAQELGCADHVRFDGPFEDEQLAVYYCSADVFVMPSRAIADKTVEGFGIVYVEAGHYGLPVIGGRVGGVPDAILDGQTGLLVDPEDPRQVAEAIISLLKDRALRQRLSAAGQERAHTELTWAAVVERINQRITSSLSRRQAEERKA